MRLLARDITAGYGSSDVLHDVSLTIQTGEFVGLIGPNGCGKSTLLRVLSGVLRPRQGAVWLDDRPLALMPRRDAARCIAFVPQQETPAFEFSVRDVALMGRYAQRSRTRAERLHDYEVVNHALALADILPLADRPVTELSGGEYRRVLLARALAQEAPLLLMDEPTAHLDVTHQVELLALAQQLSRQRLTGVLAALHELNQAAEFCDWLILMDAGRIVAQGTPDAVLTPDNLRAVYRANAQIGRNPATGRPFLLTLHPARSESERPEASRVHVICGGGSGVTILNALVRQGHRVSTGVLNRLDSDQEAADALGIETVLEAPFSPIRPEARARCADLLCTVQTIVIAPVPFGRGNLANLELAVEAQAQGKAVVLVEAAQIASRDYTEGQATRLFQQLLSGGALNVARIEEWPGLIAARP